MNDYKNVINEKRKKYLEKLKDPRWQKIRLEVFERDAWTCQRCYDTETTLNIHHRYYKDNTEPWDYPLESLVSLCENCHSEEREVRQSYERDMLHALREKFFAEEVSELAIGFHTMPLCHVSEIIASVYQWAISDEKIQRELIERYFEHIKNKKESKES